MKILWAHSHFEIGGGPKTILTWALGLRDLGHQIFFIGQGGNLLETVKANSFSYASIGKDRFRPSLNYAFQIYQYGKKINPDVLIGVGILSSMETSLAAYLLQKPILFIFNVSPRNMLWTGNSKWQFPQISDMVVINQEFKQLCITKYGWDEKKVHYIPERVIPQHKNICQGSNIQKRICIVRRLDQIKSQPIIKLIDNLQEFLKSNKTISVDIIGDGDNFTSVAEKSTEANKQLNRLAFNCIGYVDNIENNLDNYDLVIATEKAAIEAIIARKPTAIIKNDGTIIPITSENIDELSLDNFLGNSLNSSSDYNYNDLIKIIKGKNQEELEKLGAWIVEHYDYKIGAQKISALLAEISTPKHFFSKYLPQILKMYLIVFAEYSTKVASSLLKRKV